MQNANNSNISNDEIIQLDTQWREEAKVGGGSLINSKLNAPGAEKLKEKLSQSNGVYTEIFITDNKGLNVVQSNPTSDYWQGDEEKFTKSYGVGPDGIVIGDVELDESTQKLQTQVSFTVNDPETNEALGSVTVGINVENLY